jgi:hypothetical protein
LSGRIVILRMEILLTEDFIRGYLNEIWLERPLNPDNNNFVIRFLIAKGWDIRIQISKEAEVLIILEFG